jgi:outer membrane protein assembly factor BamB
VTQSLRTATRSIPSPVRRIQRPITKLLAGLVLGASIAGCQTVKKQVEIVPAPPQSFVRQWTATVPLKDDQLQAIYVRGDSLYAYSKKNQVFVFSAAGGKLLYADQVAPAIGTLRPPVLLPEGKAAFPTGDTLEIFDKAGKRLQSVKLPRPTHSPGVALVNTMYIGVDSETGGRLASLDLTMSAPTNPGATPGAAPGATGAEKPNVDVPPHTRLDINKWERLTVGGIEAAPVVYQGVAYAGTTQGKVFAINEQGAGIWSLPDGSNFFKADGPIHADLKADDVGVYAASEDGKLYCIDRGSGRIKWAYYGGAPLSASPVPTASGVYQYVPEQGLVCIDKLSHGVAKAKWINERAVRYLSEDDKYVYAQQNDGYLIALDKTNGYRVFRSQRKDFTLFSPNIKDKTIYAATADGQIYSIAPVLHPGTVGELVMDLNAAAGDGRGGAIGDACYNQPHERYDI